MKKVLIAVAAVALAVSAQAASFKWSANAISADPAGGAITSYTAYLIDASVVSYADAQAAIAAGDVSFIAGSAVLDTANTAAQGTTGNALINRTGGTTVADTSYEAYFVILNDASNPTYARISTTTKTGAGTAMTNTQLAFGSQAAGTWVAVPEPTSGLLMLVGLGALALRRRRA